MLNKLIEFSIKNKLIVGLFLIVLIGYGVYEVSRLPIDAVPDITNNQVQVITVAPALGATDIERLITFPIEQANSNLPGLKEMRSFSSFGLSVVTIVFDDDVNIYLARQQISERLQLVKDDLPAGFGLPFLAPITTGLGEIYQYVVRPAKGYEDKYNAMELRTMQDWIVRKQLLGVPGVADVSSFGGLLKQYEVAILPEKLYAFNITISDVFDALEKNNQNTGGSYIEKGSSALFIRSEGLVTNIEDIQNIVVKNLPNGIPLLIKDVAEVKFGNATRFGALTYNGELQVSGAVVLMLKGANSNEVIKKVKERISVIQKSLPEGVVIEPFIDRTKMVNNAISTVSKNLIEGALIVVFVLVLFLGNFRAGLLVASVIPLSMLFAIILMNLFGVSGNLMSLGALDFGLIVDGAVIIVEAVMHRLSHSKQFRGLSRLSQSEMDKEVNQSASRMMNSAVFGQMIILIVYLPIFSLQGIEGKMFKPMAQTVAFALIGAFVLSLTYIPMMSTLLLSKKLSHEPNISDKMMMRIEALYQKLIFHVLHHQKIVITLVIIVFGFSIFILTKLGGEFIPSLPEGDFAVETRILPGSTINSSIEIASKASKILLEKFPEVERVVTKTGSGEVPTDPMPMDASDMIVVLKSRSEWTSATTYQELESKMTEALKVIPGVNFGFQYPVVMRFNELISGAKQDVVCKIFGDNLDTLASYAERLGKICKTVEGASSVYVESVSGIPQIRVNYNRKKIAQYGLNIKDVNRTIKTAFAGENSGTVYEGEKRFGLVVRLESGIRNHLESVQNLLIPTPAGLQIPLSTVADVEIIEGPNQIQRENTQRRIIVGFNARGRDVQSIVQDLQKKVDADLKLPMGYQITYGGAFENLEAAKSRLLIAVPVSLALIFVLLYFAFGSVKLSVLIYSAIPLSAIGGILALGIRGISFSISAGVGFIALFGVAVLNGIVLIAEFNRLKSDGFTNLKRIVIKGTKVRLRPVLMTAFVASLGFFPMAVSTGEGAEVQRPLATVVIGGLLIATFLTLFVLPILYLIFHPKRKKMNQFPTLAFFLLVCSISNGIAQEPILLKNAIDSALANNLSFKNEKLKKEYQEKLLKSAVSIPSTSISMEYGQINSIFSDSRIGISQSLSFPTVYARQKELIQQELKNSILNVGVEQASLKKQVEQAFNTIIFLEKKKQLLLKNDSVFSDFLVKSKMRFQKGESGTLELSTAENLYGQISVQLQQLNSDLEIAHMQFQLLLNTTAAYTPDLREGFKTDLSSIDSSKLMNHPKLNYWKQKQEIATVATRLERSKLLPGLALGYNIMSMRGTGADNVIYNTSLRFQSIQLGLSIPIFYGSQRARINAAKTNEKLASNEYAAQSQIFWKDFNIALTTYEKYKQLVSYFEDKALLNAEKIYTSAGKLFATGEINYLEWVMLINQAVTINSEYLDALKNRSNSVSELKYYLNQ
jgi:cobalt-zinc-cadmium resistance protein CzcA